MKSITITQLHYVVQVAKLGHFGRAAKACFVTQPTLSMQIQKLEETLDATLFDRSKQPIKPTPMGHKVLAIAHNIVDLIGELEETVKGEGAVTGEFRMGIIPTLAPYVLPRFLPHFSKKFPSVDLILEELQTAVIVERLQENSLDCGLLATPLGFPNIEEYPIFVEPFVLYLSESHPLSKLKSVTENDLVQSEIWLLSEGHCFRDQTLDLCQANRKKSLDAHHVHFESGNLETLKKLVDSNGGYTLLPYLAALDLAKSRREKRIRPFRTPIPSREVSLITKVGFIKKNILKSLEETILASLPDELRTSDKKKSRILRVEA